MNLKPSAICIVDSDPRSSGRPAEAVRIAAGVSVWKSIEVSLYLRGPAILMLSEDVDDLVDQDNFSRYLPVLSESGRPIYVQQGSTYLKQLEKGEIPFEEISDRNLARMAAERSLVFRF